MNAPARILIVDDEDGIRFYLEELLSRDGYEVSAVESGERALDAIAAQQFDLALLDLRLKGISGMEVLAALRQRSLDTAVIVLTAHGSMETAIDALRHGAHDYLLKPSNAATLRESVRTALVKREREQRQQGLLQQVEQSLLVSLEEIRAAVVKPPPPPEPKRQETPASPPATLTRGGLVLDLAQRVISLDGQRLELSRTEFEVLAYLAEKAPKIVNAQELVLKVQGYDCDRFEAADIARHHIHRIRQKAKACAGRTDFIRTVRGVGYLLKG